MTAFKIVDTVREMIAGGDLSSARELCEQHLRNHPIGAEPSILQGLLLTMEGRPNEAVTAYDAALSFAPDALPAYQGIAEILAGKNWLHSALVVMENASQATNLTPAALLELDALRTRVAETANPSSVGNP